jgi:ubiquinone/menaquinone biosynthesis C-methylase UbiE
MRGLYCGACKIVQADKNSSVHTLANEWGREPDQIVYYGCKTDTNAIFCRDCMFRDCVSSKKIELEHRIQKMLFNKIGETYNKTRAADGRIISELIRLLDLQKGAIVADIGAGTGNYSFALANAGYKIKAIEPSATIVSHSQQDLDIEWFIGCAENIPLQAGSVDANVSILALPHFSDIECAFKEMARILKNGPIVIFTFDPAIGKRTWMYRYFPFFGDHFNHFPMVKETATILGNCTNLTQQIIPFELPSDLADNFAAAAWKRPYLYLNQDYRSNIFSFRMTDSDIVESSVKQLSSDLECGRWETLYGEVHHFDKYDAGYFFILAK